MKRLLIAAFALVALSFNVFAQGQQQQQQPNVMDYTKMGPWTSKPANEDQTRKDVLAFFKQEEELMQKRDMEAMLNRIDFPIFMVTDDTKGVVHAQPLTREQYRQTMQPFMESWPKDAKITHKPNVTVLSDTLVNVVDEFSTTLNKQKLNGRSASVLIKKDGQWKWKTMTEAGWGAMDMPQAQGSSKPTPGAPQR